MAMAASSVAAGVAIHWRHRQASLRGISIMASTIAYGVSATHLNGYGGVAA